MRPLTLYLTGTATWFLSFGLQSVMFSWLVAMVLLESPDRVGVAQMALLLPGTLLILVGGSYADRFGGARIAALAQFLAALAPWLLIVLLLRDALTFPMMLCYAVLMGCAQAFVTPARDGLLNRVAGQRVQRVVMFASVAQFGSQIFGIGLAGLADSVGAAVVLGIQSLVLLIGAVALARIQLPAAPVAAPVSLFNSVRQGAKSVWASGPMRWIALQNVAMAICFMGSYTVTIPLLVREVYAGGAGELATLNAMNSLGLVSTIVILIRFGDVRRQGRLLLLSQFAGSLLLAAAGLAGSFPLLALSLFCWGCCGGLALTMARTIMQEQAPPDQISRVMGFHAVSFMGAGPVGALVNGYLVEFIGPAPALVTAALAMFAIIAVVALASPLWHLGHVRLAAAP